MDIVELLNLMVENKASDLHLRVPNVPVLRVDGDLRPQNNLPPVTTADVEAAFEHITTQDQRSRFHLEKELDFAYSVPGLARFRVSVMRQRGTISLAFRLVPFKVFTIEELALPEICKELILKPRGLILVTGPTGSGKSTTMAAMLNHLNENIARNVITIEDPIEYLHPNIKCLIAQRDLGDDTKAFDIALIHALRHDPDVIVVGELRDFDTIQTAMRAATDAPQTVDRIIDIFPPSQQPQIRLQFSQVLVAVLSQALLPRASSKGRIAAFEIMTGNSAVKNLIREGKTFELHSVMQLSSSEGMQTLDQALADLVRKRIVALEEAKMKSSHPDRLKKLLDYQHGAVKR
jgi:twitching motility protein PilT